MYQHLLYKPRQMRLIDLDEHMAEREERLRGRQTIEQSTRQESKIEALMMPGLQTHSKLGKRPISKQGTFNQRIIAQSPGSSRNTGLDFVKAVYAVRTGQEQEDWTREF